MIFRWVQEVPTFSYFLEEGAGGKRMHILTKLIKDDMRPALGVTEPGAIAYAVALAKQHVTGTVKKICVLLNSGMYKNAFTCGIPNSDHVGNIYAAALGAVAGNPEKGLEALEEVTEEAQLAAEKMIEEGIVQVQMDHVGSEITIDAVIKTSDDECTVKIAGGHTDVYFIEKNGQVIFSKERLAQKEEQPAQIHNYTLKELVQYIRSVDENEIAFIHQAFQVNMELLKEGLSSDKTTFAPLLLEKNKGKIFSDSEIDTAQLLCNGAIEARVLGLNKPAMSITGSGAHGIIATLPLLAYYKIHEEELSEDALLRATALSYLITMYIKEYSGKLSAFCGCGIAAGTGMACGLCYLKGGEIEAMEKVICNMASGITGMICDGGNQGCTMKGIVAVDAAFRAVNLALAGASIHTVHGINGKTPEDTMRYMGRIASPGMTGTEQTIVEIMQEKQEG